MKREYFARQLLEKRLSLNRELTLLREFHLLDSSKYASL